MTVVDSDPANLMFLQMGSVSGPAAPMSLYILEITTETVSSVGGLR